MHISNLLFAKLFLLSVLLPISYTLDANSHIDYIGKYKDLAIQEMERTGVPASIKLAQGLLESGAGSSDLARKANNHFGIKCGGNWDGATFDKIDDDRDANGRLIPSCFRRYKRARDSWIAHSEFLRDGFRYRNLFSLDRTDYKGWARGLKRAGYATKGSYAQDLIRIIETYKLYQYDQERLNIPEVILDLPVVEGGTVTADEPVIDELPDVIPKTATVNDARITFALGNETLEDIAKRADVKLSDIEKYNDGRYQKTSVIERGARVYLQPKRRSYRGKERWHKVATNQTMLDISHRFGVDLKQLYKRNLMKEDTQPAAGEYVILRGKRGGDAPKLVKEQNEPTEAISIPKVKISPEVPSNEEAIPDEDEDGIIDMEDVVYEDELVLPEFDEEFDEEFDIVLPNIKTTPPSIEEVPVIDTPIVEIETQLNHQVKKGETLYRIAVNNGTTVDQLKTLNNLTNNTIHVGQILRIR